MNNIIQIAIAAAVLVGPQLAAQDRSAAPVGRGGGQTIIVGKAPKDHAIAIPKEDLLQYYRSMDANQQQTVRLLEGGKYNVNIRRIAKPEAALVHPNTIDVWVVLEGGGMLTTGGKLEGGRIIGGASQRLNAGDVAFIPAGLPHGVSGVNSNMTWLNVRWDNDWPSGAEMGAGDLSGRGRAGLPAGGRGLRPIEYASENDAVAISREKLDAYQRDMESRNSAALRMIEGGHFNVNIRRIKEPSVEFHKVTIDTWVVLEGGGVVNTGFQAQDGKRIPGTGESFTAKPGDVFFVPSNVSHGFGAVNGVVSWLNIRWDDDYEK